MILQVQQTAEPGESDLGHEIGSDYEVPHRHLQSYHQICPRLRSNGVRQRINQPTPETGSDSVQRFEAVLWSDDNYVCISTTG